MGTLFLCYYGDGPYWDNTLVLTGYPSGYSYFRPFRYRDAWVQPDLLKDIADAQKRQEMIGEEVVICMRFQLDPHKGCLLPVRKAVVQYVDYVPGNHSIHFSMGRLFDFSTLSSLASACTTMDAVAHATVQNALFFRADLSIPLSTCKDLSQEDAAWVCFADMVGGETTLPISEEAKKGLFLRLHKLDGKSPADIGVVHKSLSTGDIHGALLAEGASYELTFSHRLPSLIAKNTSLVSSTLKYKATTGNLELAFTDETLTGNYQKHEVSLTARNASGAWERVEIEPADKIQTTAGSDVKAAQFHIPVKVKVSLRYRLSKTYLWLMLLWAGLVGNAVLALCKPEQPDAPLLIVAALLALCAAVGVYGVEHGKST